MTFSAENILLIGSVLLFVSVVASKTSLQFGIPTLLFFLVVGMLAGSDGLGGIYFNDPKIAQMLGVMALTLILFSGGLDTKWESTRPVVRTGIALSTLGVLLTAIFVGLCCYSLLDVPLLEAMLLGAIVSSTDAAAVFSILRSRRLGLKGNLRPLLEFESGSNDPMAFFLTTAFIYLISFPDASWTALILKFVVGMSLGAGAGYVLGRLMLWVINHISLDIEGLYSVLLLAFVFFCYSATDAVGGNGFLAVYVSAIMLGNSNFIHKKSLMKFYDGMAWLMQIVMFLTLGLLVFPKEIVPVVPEGLLISAVLIFVARPLAVFISTMFSSGLSLRKKWFVSWVGLRGASPIVFATYPMLAGIAYANTIFNLVFFISVTSVLLQGALLPWVAKALHVSVPEKVRRKFPLDIELKEGFKSELLEIDVAAGSVADGKPVVELEMPKGALIVMINRQGKYITASGDTHLEAGDHLLMMADNKTIADELIAFFGDSKGD